MALLFNRPEYFQRQQGVEVLRFQGRSERGNAWQWHFVRQGEAMIAPWQAPYSIPAWQHPPHRDDWQAMAEGLVAQAEALENPPPQLQIGLPPEGYAQLGAAEARRALEGQGFAHEYHELNHQLPVGSGPLSEKMNASHRRKLRKLEAAGFRFRLGAPAELPQFHQMLGHHRKNYQIPLSMGQEALEGSFQDWPGHYRLCVVEAPGEEWAAACIAVADTPDSLYYFLPFDAEKWRHRSPSVLLVAGLYGLCRQEGRGFLNLGISSVKGTVNQGLSTFKERCGALQSPQYRLRKALFV